MSEKPILYNFDISPAVRSVKIIAKLIDLDLEIRDLDLFTGEHLREPFINLNPEHTVPTLDDNGDVIWESHAICTYLIDKYASDDTLYPKDLFQRAKCNQRLFFDNASLFQRLRASHGQAFQGGSEISQQSIDALYESFNLVEAFLESDSFLVGENVTVADICCSITIIAMSNFAPLDAERYPNVVAWLDRIKNEVPFFEEMNDPFNKQYFDIVQDTLLKNKEKE